MMGHQYTGVHPTLELQRRLVQILQIAQVVDITKETRLTIIATLGNLLGYASKIASGHTRHDAAPLIRRRPSF